MEYYQKKQENVLQKFMYLTWIYLTKKCASPNKNYKRKMVHANVILQEIKYFLSKYLNVSKLKIFIIFLVFRNNESLFYNKNVS